MTPRPRSDYSEAVKLYQDGLSVAEVARQFQMSRQAMWKILRLRGCKIRGRGENANA